MHVSLCPFFLIVCVLALTISDRTWASACCARNSAAPNLIVGDDRAQFNLGLAVGGVVAEATSEGAAIFGSPQASDWLRTYRLDGTILLSDRWQVGLGLAFVDHDVAQGELSDSGSSFGDTRLSLGYEFLPAWTYSPWKPQGFLFAVITLPTGRSIFEQQGLLAGDVTGNGFYSLSCGAFFLKRFGHWDTFAVSEVHYSLPRAFQDSHGFEFQAYPGFGGSAGAGGGVSPGGGAVRLGLRIQPRLDQPQLIPAFHRQDMRAEVAMTCDLGVDMSYLLNPTNTVWLSFVDQTLLGPAMNSNLNRILSVNYQHRWER